jgi:putative peptidoglycan binding protein
MRELLCLANIFALVALPFAAGAVTQKSTAKKGTKSAVAAGTKGGSSSPTARKKTNASASSRASSTKSGTSKRGKKAPARNVRARQLTPTPERYKQIQDALAAKGYLPAAEANGRWNDSSTEALKKFQVDQNLDATGKINSISLIALGLGPKRDAMPPPKPAASPSTP